MAWVLSLGAGKEQIPLLKAIKNEGHKVVGVDIDPMTDGVPLCDVFRGISNRDTDKIVEFAEWAGVQGVIVAATEVADVGAIVAHRLGLPGIPISAAMICKDKLRQKDVLKAAGIPHTEAIPVYRGSAKAAFDSLGYKVVVKPRMGSGSRGVNYVNNPMGLDICVQGASFVCHDVIMEKYQPGPQISAEVLFFDKQSIVVAFVDRFYPPGHPSFIEVGGTTPSVWESEREAAHEVMRKAANALGVTRGTLKFDLVLTTKGPKIIEVTPRLSGGPLSSIVKDSTGVDYLRQAVRICLGEEPDWTELMPKKHERIARYMDGTDIPLENIHTYAVQELGA